MKYYIVYPNSKEIALAPRPETGNYKWIHMPLTKNKIYATKNYWFELYDVRDGGSKKEVEILDTPIEYYHGPSKTKVYFSKKIKIV